MKAANRSRTPFPLVVVVLMALALSAVTCSSLGSVPAEPAAEHGHEQEAVDEHSHDENVGDDHGHAADGEDDHGKVAAGGQNHDEGDGSEIDHHGNPIYDEEERVYEQIVQDGVSVEFTVENFLGVGGRGGEIAPRIVAGEHAVLQFHITESDSGTPLSGLRLAVWLNPQAEEVDEETCRAQVRSYLRGTPDSRPLVDLNSYFILGMNQDNTISVIDPMIDVAGMTNLFAVIILQGAPEDWAMTADQQDLLVTLPELNKVAVIDLENFQVDENIDVRGRPQRVDVQPDGRYAWVGIESVDGRGDGVAVIDVTEHRLVAEIASGAGPHTLAFSPDSRRAFVTNGEAGTLTVVDTQSLRTIKDLDLGGRPASVTTASGKVYVADPRGGSLIVVDGERLAVTGRIPADPGVAVVAVSPDGAWGFAANPQEQTLYVFETANDRITHAVPVKGTPDQITFTETAAYIRSRSTPVIFAIPLAEIDPTGNVSVLTVPIGVLPPDAADGSLLANAVSVAPDSGALLISNPADDKIYFYTEGAQSATGGFQGHTLAPRAVQVVDRSLKERAPGVYTGGLRVPREGDFTVAFLLSDPQVLHCFQFSAKANPGLAAKTAASRTEVNLMTTAPPKAGETYALQIRLSEANGGAPMEGVADLLVMARVLAGNWNQRAVAADLGDGVYEVRLTFPRPGMYSLYFMAPSVALTFDQVPQRTLQVVAR